MNVVAEVIHVIKDLNVRIQLEVIYVLNHAEWAIFSMLLLFNVKVIYFRIFLQDISNLIFETYQKI
jgi:hypothetical protein